METTTLATTTWAIDPIHSEVQFSVRHLMISNVTGNFFSFEGKLETVGDNFEMAKATFSAAIDSISTNVTQRDQHLKSPDFFDATNYPSLAFTSTSIKKTKDETYEMIGNLTIRGTTKPINLKVEYGGKMIDSYGNTKAGFGLSGKISRKEFGLLWNGITEAGSIVASDEVKLILNIQVVQQ